MKHVLYVDITMVSQLKGFVTLMTREQLKITNNFKRISSIANINVRQIIINNFVQQHH